MRRLLATILVVAPLCGCAQMPANDGPPTTEEPDCGFGETAENGACVASRVPQIQLGFGNPYEPIIDGDEMPTAAGFQGLMDALVAYRLHGFDDQSMLVATISLFLNETDEPLVQDFATSGFSETSENGFSILQQGFTIFASPADVWGKDARVVVEVHDFGAPDVSATLEQDVILVEISDDRLP